MRRRPGDGADFMCKRRAAWSILVCQLPQVRHGNELLFQRTLRFRFEGRPAVAGQCDVCGKAKTFGNNVSFSKRRTSRDYRPNVQKKRIVVNGVGLRLNICTRCLRTLGKSGKAA
jgi:large subunit ribosomal protein L28